MPIKIDFMRINMPIKSSILCRKLLINFDYFKFTPIEMAKIDLFASCSDFLGLGFWPFNLSMNEYTT